ncbi:MAG: hypothetical protein ACW99Q_26140 [Candidatus Kariarchaeaceae archaeon]|jgi:hypothetical protein
MIEMDDEIFEMELRKIHPSQLYINHDKLVVTERFIFDHGIENLEPIPIKKLDDRLIMTDGHTKALALYKCGYDTVRVWWEDEQLDWDEYRECLKWCDEENIHTIANLSDRVISNKEYETQWLERCRKMRERLKKLT